MIRSLMSRQSPRSKTTQWSALAVGLVLIAFGVAMFAFMLFSKGILEASPYVVAIVGGIYVGMIPWRRTKTHGKSDSAARR
jgi:uncharacterized membrane protein HdeD (DUF308 family)